MSPANEFKYLEVSLVQNTAPVCIVNRLIWSTKSRLIAYELGIISHNIIIVFFNIKTFSDPISSLRGPYVNSIQDQVNLSNVDVVQDLDDSSKERFRLFGDGDWLFPEGSPVVSQNFLESNIPWHEINPHPPIDPDDSEENIPSLHSGSLKESFILYSYPCKFNLQ